MNASNPVPTVVTSGDGRVFEHVGSRPHTRWDGTQVLVHLWQGTCVLCGRPYQVTGAARPSRGSLGVITCREHRGMIRRIRRPVPRADNAAQ
jgi:hypothetical protein